MMTGLTVKRNLSNLSQARINQCFDNLPSSCLALSFAAFRVRPVSLMWICVEWVPACEVNVILSAARNMSCPQNQPH